MSVPRTVRGTAAVSAVPVVVPDELMVVMPPEPFFEVPVAVVAPVGSSEARAPSGGRTVTHSARRPASSWFCQRVTKESTPLLATCL